MEKNKVKQPKKAKKAVEELHDLVDQLRYFYQDNQKFKKEVLKKAIYVEDVLHTLSVDKKIEHARFVNKFKSLFGKENKELKEENKKLKQEVEKRGKMIGELVEENKELVEIVIMNEESNEM